MVDFSQAKVETFRAECKGGLLLKNEKDELGCTIERREHATANTVELSLTLLTPFFVTAPPFFQSPLCNLIFRCILPLSDYLNLPYMRHLLLLQLCLFLLCTSVKAQDFDFPDAVERIFPVSAKMVWILKNQDLSSREIPDLGEPYPEGTSGVKLPPGHYLKTRVLGEKVAYSYFNTYEYELEIGAEGGKFQLRVYGPDGQARADATVTIDGKKVRYSKKYQAYRRRDWHIDYLTVAVGKDTLFYQVDENIERSRFNHDLNVIRKRQPFRTIQLPYIYGKSIYGGLRQGIFDGNWWGMRNVQYPFKGTIRRALHPFPITGYVTTNQPKYRPGDTLKISAYLAKPKGRPLHADSVEMRISQHYQRTHLLSRKVGRGEKGRYTLTMPIPTDWSLDKDYTVSFAREGFLARDISPAISFRLEDYELAEYKLTVAASDDTRLPSSAWLDIGTKDINGLALPDGEIKVTALLQKFLSTADSAIISLPDTLYRYTESTDNRKTRRLILPDSLFPYGYSLEVKILTQLTGPSGEYDEITKTVVIDRRYRQVPEIKVVGDSLYLNLAPASAPRTATLQTINNQKDTITSKGLLPAKILIDHQQSRYRLIFEGQEISQSVASLSPAGGNLIQWSRDTLRLDFSNKHRQLFRWQLYRGQQQIASGNQDVPTFTQSNFSPGTSLELHYHYLAGGQWQYRKKPLQTPRYDLLTEHKNVLALVIDQPQKVSPGETVRVALQATDQKGRPAPNVRLSAGSYNARFDEPPVTTPDYIKKRKRRREKQGYREDKFSISRDNTPPEWLVNKLKLDTALAYQLRYPKPTFELLRDLDTLMPDSIYQAHIAPFVIKGNKPVKVRTVYADDRLVYWYHPNITTPYSIPLDSGHHQISLRTAKFRFNKSVYLPARKQLVLSFDSEHWVSAGWERQEIKKFSEEEIRRVHRRVFALKNTSANSPFYFRKGRNEIIQSGKNSSSGNWSPLGLARPNAMLDFWFSDEDSLSLRFEPEAIYRISKGRDRLYPLDRKWVENALNSRSEVGVAKPGLPAYSFKPRPVLKLGPVINGITSMPKINKEEPRTRLQLADLPKGVKTVIIAPVNYADHYIALRSQPMVLSPGTYDLLFFFESDSIRNQRITLLENQITQLNYEEDSTKPFHALDTLGRHSLSRSAKKIKVTYEEKKAKWGRITGTVIDAETGNPIISATVQMFVEGKLIAGAVADIKGFFSFNVPKSNFTIQVDFTGYPSVKYTNISPGFRGNHLTLELSAGVNLDMVVVPCYSRALMDHERRILGQTLTAEQIRNLPTRNINEIVGRAAGVIITHEGGAVSIRGSRSNATIYYVDGVRVSATSIPDSEFNEGRLGAALKIQTRGLRTATSGLTGRVDGNLLPLDIRSNFSDYAAFVPDIRTDRDGKAVFDITFPDDITSWNTFAVGQDRRRRVAFTLEQTRAFLPFQAQLYLPRFLVEGDKSEAATLAINREGGERAVRLSFSDDKEEPRTQDAVLVASLEERYPIEASVGADSLSYQFTVQAMDGKEASDGERRSLPVYPQGTEMVSGELFMLTDNTTALPDSFLRAKRGPVTLRLLGNRLQQLLADIDNIVVYPYGCTEQTASRLIGLLAVRNIRKAEGKAFEEDGHIITMVSELEKRYRRDGGFGWWRSSRSSSTWISLHVYQALSAASKQGYSVKSLTPVKRYLLGQLPELGISDQLQILLAIAEGGNTPTNQEMFNLETLPAPSDYQLLAITRLHQLRGDTVDIQRLLDSSSRHAVNGLYWGDRRFRFYRQPLNDRLACGLLAHQIFSAAGKDDEAASIINYLLGQTASTNRPGNVPLLGTNTLESAKLVAGLLPSLLSETGLEAPSVTLALNGQQTKVDEFPFETSFPPEEAENLALLRSGSGPIPVAVYQRWFETNPTAQNAGFQLTTELLDARDRPLNQLRLGQTAFLEVTVNVAADTDYVLIEIPIPAGCSYQKKNEAKGPFAVHREYRRDRVAIFCDRLPAGEYTYKVALAPRFSGQYTLNPARAEMQYMPVVNGSGEMKKVRIGE